MADMLDNEKDEPEFSGEEEYTPEYGDVGGPEVDLNAKPEIEFSPDMDELPDQSSPMRKLLGYAGIGVGALLIALYMGYRDSGKDQQQGVPDEPVVAKVPKIQTPPSPAAVKPIQLTPVTAVQQPTTDVLNVDERINRIGQQVKTNQLTIDNIAVRVQTLESTSSEIKETVNRIDTRLEQVGKKAIRKPVVRKKVYSVRKVARKPVYRELYGLKAVVPGRAWLQTASGEMMSVGVGSPIYGLGIVRSIDAPKGRVATSSGAVIIYGPGDH